MRQTMLHIDTPLDENGRKRLCAHLESAGVTCDSVNTSTKPHLLFIAYEESRTTPGDLVRVAADAGLAARVVDL